MQRTIVRTDQAPRDRAYSQRSSVAVSNSRQMIFCSGQIPLESGDHTMIEGDISAQTRRVLDNLPRCSPRPARRSATSGEDDDLPRRHERLRRGERAVRRAFPRTTRAARRCRPRGGPRCARRDRRDRDR